MPDAPAGGHSTHAGTPPEGAPGALPEKPPGPVPGEAVAAVVLDPDNPVVAPGPFRVRLPEVAVLCARAACPTATVSSKVQKSEYRIATHRNS